VADVAKCSTDKVQIHTNLPASDESFQSGRPAPTQSLVEALHTAGSDLSGFAGAILLAAMLGRNLEHMHRISVDDNEGDLNGKYWTRHRDIDNILLNLTMGMPEALRIPQGLPDPNVIFMNMCVHTSVICLHQSAMSRADKHQLTGSISAESKMRCITAALEIASIMRAIAHLDLATVCIFILHTEICTTDINSDEPFHVVLSLRRSSRFHSVPACSTK